MTQPHKMPDDPGAPEVTDPEATSAEQTEAAAEEAAVSQGEADTASAVAPEDEAIDDPEVQEMLEEIDTELEAHESDTADLGEETTPDLQSQLDERTEDLKRVSAEYANYRRRTDRERVGIAEQAKASVIAKFLPVLDDLDLAAQHGDLDEGPLKAFADKFQAIVQAEKLEAFGAEGEAFDPEIHEAVQDLSEGDDKAIGTVLRKGYRVGDRMIRTAMVIIADPVVPEE
ncbi:nucleotide exchange factor GrpE [Corynebacterium poyangense]|uniref:Protein GrpE n=1 Tax=Corynebacterium poyangense TaxID=2684405 RepID=A0A7H0SRF7_9CORY|nr:nucleotide exchange factor GrpE [Corynebacterium poyangense]QNQ91132.1 nucleotide exchange factor GrpE [Corynebacterium poyangense]